MEHTAETLEEQGKEETNNDAITNKVPSPMLKPRSRIKFQPQARPIGSSLPSRAAAVTKTPSRALNFRGAPANMQKYARPHRHNALISSSFPPSILISKYFFLFLLIYITISVVQYLAAAELSNFIHFISHFISILRYLDFARLIHTAPLYFLCCRLIRSTAPLVLHT